MAGQSGSVDLEGMSHAQQNFQTAFDEVRYAWHIMTGRPYLMPPGVPADRLATMRAAFDATMQDSEFLADAEKTHLMIDPLTAGQMQDLLKKAYGSSPAVVERARDLMKRAFAGK